MGLFRSREEKTLDTIIERIDMAMSNNYKDQAQEDFSKLESTFERMKQNNVLKEKAKEKYERICDSYRTRLKGYTHKDQKPFWTK